MIRLSEIMNEQDPCWKGYKQVGMKDKDGREVPNCVPESVNEGHFGEIDIMAQEASNFREFVKDFYKEYKDFPKDRDTMKWLESLYKSRANEGLDSQGLERVAAGLPQTEEEPIEEGMFKIGVKHIIPLIPTGYAPNDPKYKGDLRYLRNMLNNFYKERGYEKVILPSF